MSTSIRPATHEDVGGIVEWTTDTFKWGDYVPDRISGWIDDPDSEVMVCVDSSDIPVAVAHAVMLSPTEGWLEAARVHPDHRRSGLGSALNSAGVAWIRQRGGRVVRLATEADNKAARAQVETLGYRQISRWLFASMAIDHHTRPAPDLRLRPAPGSDVDPAWMFWSTSELAMEGRGFIANGWQWRRATPADLAIAATDGEFFQSASGWTIADSPDEDTTRTKWLATTREEAPGLFEGLIDLAARRGSSDLTIKLPNIPWAREAMARVGGAPAEILIYSKAVM